MARFTVESARKFLYAADVFYYNDLEEEVASMKGCYKPEDWPKEEKFWREEMSAMPQTLNMNDVWAWALADCYRVPDEELIECAELMWRYGWAGILYFVSSKTNAQRSEFHDNNRMIDFVANEERIRKEKPGSSERAYFKTSYTLGAT